MRAFDVEPDLGRACVEEAMPVVGRDVVLRSLADVQRCGIAPYLGTAGLDQSARELSGVEYELVAVGTRTRSYRDVAPLLAMESTLISLARG